MATTYKLIASVTLGSAATNITFSSIPATHDDLVVVGSLRGTTSAAVQALRLRFNGAASDTNHSMRRLYGSGSAAVSDTQSAIYVSPIPAATATSDTFSSFEVYIPNYAGSANKSVNSTGVQETNGATAYIYAVAGLWADTSAVTDLEFAPIADSLAAGSTAYLYGITKA